ncbi:MAG: hypothetical protein M1820_001577 [Bogoriella megaspora]|nr:MAG: hypothetical protein M1820_001577 [Bogoriella megaspora]
MVSHDKHTQNSQTSSQSSIDGSHNNSDAGAGVTVSQDREEPRKSSYRDHRHSLPTNPQLKSLWQESGFKKLSDADSVAAHRASALRQLSGTPLRGRLRHRSIASTGTSRTSLSSQPVLVRSYSGSRSRQSSRARQPPSGEHLGDAMGKDVKFVPADNFAFDGILRAIEPDVKDTIDAIAQIYSRTKLSLSDEYNAHMPPLGEITSTGRSRHSAATQRQTGNESTLSAVPEASSSSERLADEARASKKSSLSSFGGEQRKSAYGALVDVISKSPPRDKTPLHEGKNIASRNKQSDTAAELSSSMLSNVRLPKSGFVVPSRAVSRSASISGSPRSSLGLVIGRSITDNQAASAEATLDLSSPKIEGASSRPASAYEMQIGTPRSSSGIWLPWLKSSKNESSNNAENVLKSLLNRAQSDFPRHVEGS